MFSFVQLKYLCEQFGFATKSEKFDLFSDIEKFFNIIYLPCSCTRSYFIIYVTHHLRYTFKIFLHPLFTYSLPNPLISSKHLFYVPFQNSHREEESFRKVLQQRRECFIVRGKLPRSDREIVRKKNDLDNGKKER